MSNLINNIKFYSHIKFFSSKLFHIVNCTKKKNTNLIIGREYED